MIIDIHTHTRPRSEDSLLTPSELIEQAKRAGLDGICVTEHDWFWDADELAALNKEHNFLILPGVELNTEDGHLLVFGLEKYEFGMHHTEYVRRLLDENNGFMILAHPYRRHLHREDDILTAVDKYYQKPVFNFVDTIEILNGRGTPRQNNFSNELCRKLGFKGTGGSDCHKTAHVPTCATCFKRNIRNLEELITELQAGRYEPVDLRHSL